MIGKKLLGHYEITDLLGGGGSGETYIAVDHARLNMRCVVKRLKLPSSDLKALDKVRQMFSQEAETLEALGREHKQIPTLLAYFEEEEEFYLVQDFIKGQPLHVELPSGHRWSEAKVVQMLQDILQILEFIHHKGVIHRDLKPANLIRQQEDGKLVLIDFGAVKQMQQDPLGPAPMNPTTIAIGTAGYMPTEQARGKPRPSSDIYALGIIGIQAITGINPGNLQEDPDGEIVWRSYVPQINEALAVVLTKMVCYHFKDRYQTATEVLQDIQPLVEQHFGRSVMQQGSPASATERATPTALEGIASSNPSVVGAEASQMQPQPGSGAVDPPAETKFVLFQDSHQLVQPNDGPDAIKVGLLDGDQSKKPSIEKLLRWVATNRVIAITGLGVVIGAIAIPTGIWFLHSTPPKPQLEHEKAPAPVNANVLKGDYRKLQSYLQNQDWKNADEETYQVMLKVAGPESEQQGYFSEQEWNDFSCSDLKEIDRFWSKASGGKLGFSAQQRVLQASGKNNFYRAIGWRTDTPNNSTNSWLVSWKYDPKEKKVKYLSGKEPNFTNPSSIEGHLPAKLWWKDEQDYRFKGFVEHCKL